MTSTADKRKLVNSFSRVQAKRRDSVAINLDDRLIGDHHQHHLVPNEEYSTKEITDDVRCSFCKTSRSAWRCAECHIVLCRDKCFNFYHTLKVMPATASELAEQLKENPRPFFPGDRREDRREQFDDDDDDENEEEDN